MTDLTIGEHTFILGKMPVRKQFHVARRLAPLFSSFVGQDGGIAGAKRDLASMQVGPIADALSSMKDEDCDYVLDACLGVVKIMQNDRAMPLMNGSRCMFEPIVTLPMMLQISAEVVMQDLAGFMAGVRSPSTDPAAA